MSAEEEEAKDPRAMRLKRRKLRDSTNPFEFTEDHFQELYALSRECGKYLVNALSPFIKERVRSTGIPGYLKILATLNFYATGSYQRRGEGDTAIAALCQSSLSNVIREVTEGINDSLLDDWITFPRTREDREAVKTKFLEASNFPGVIGCMGCTHLSIVSPSAPQHKRDYICERLTYHSLNAMLVCDSELQIMFTNARHPGQHEDQFVYEASGVSREMEKRYAEGEGQGEWIIADCSYTASPWVLTPLLNQPEVCRYTQSHTSILTCFERCVGTLKGRWQCLLLENTLHYSPVMAGMIFNACAVLHNMALRYRLPAVILRHDEVDLMPSSVAAEPAEEELHLYHEGLAVRDALIKEHFS